MSTSLRSVLLAGATGLVGSHCLRLLLDDEAVERVVAVVRRPLPASSMMHPKASKLEQQVVDFSRLADYADRLRADAVVCALGTTIKLAGSQERFREVDFHYPLQLARAALDAGARHFALVSALGADATSRVFYNRVKGELEDALRALPYPALTIVRPSLLLGERSAFRLGEQLAARLGFLAPKKYKPVQAADVAAALVEAALGEARGVRVIESAEIARGSGL